MQIPEDTVLLRIFIGESDRHCRQPLYEAIALKARNGVASAHGIWKFFAFPWISQ
jgi:uncharacterized protein